jgi:hypothetical protein
MDQSFPSGVILWEVCNPVLLGVRQKNLKVSFVIITKYQ